MISMTVLMSMHCFFYPVIQHIILPQIGSAHDNIKQNGIQGDHCVLDTPYRETTVFGPHDPKYDTTSDWLVPTQKQTKHIQGDHCVLETPYKETTILLMQ